MEVRDSLAPTICRLLSSSHVFGYTTLIPGVAYPVAQWCLFLFFFFFGKGFPLRSTRIRNHLHFEDSDYSGPSKGFRERCFARSSLSKPETSELQPQYKSSPAQKRLAPPTKNIKQVKIAIKIMKQAAWFLNKVCPTLAQPFFFCNGHWASEILTEMSLRSFLREADVLSLRPTAGHPEVGCGRRLMNLRGGANAFVCFVVQGLLVEP